MDLSPADLELLLWWAIVCEGETDLGEGGAELRERIQRLADALKEAA